MNKKKAVLTLSIMLVVLIAVSITVFAAFDMEKPIAVMNGILGLDTMPNYADANEDGVVNVLDIISLMRDQKLGNVYLDSIALDDNNYTIGTFDKNRNTYTVALPDGRPAIPQVSATAAKGLDVKVYQAFIPDGETEGKAVIVVSNGSVSNNYTVKFVRNSENGFVLQYDDRYALPIAEDGYAYSSNSEALTVDENGLMTAKAVTNIPITVTATKGSDSKTFTVNRIEKAHINLFFVTGQSNGQGCYDGVTVDGEGTLENPNQIVYDVQLNTVIRPDQKGKVYSFDVHPRSENVRFYGDPAFQANVIYDMHDFSRQGFSSPLGVDWYEYTGEKVIFLQSAWSGSPIEAWLNPETHPEESGTYGNATRNFYQTTKAGYNTLVGLLEENYEILRSANFWLQGETATAAVYDKSRYNYHFSYESTYDPTKLMTAETYYKYFKWLDEDMRKDFGLDYNGILSIRSNGQKTKQMIVPIISAQFALCNENDDIFIAMRKVMEITRQFVDPDKTSDGWNFMGTDNNHYNQIGYNRVGAESAENAFNFIFRPTTRRATGIEIIDTDGKTRLEDGHTLEIQAGTTYRLGALSLPHYTSEKITWTSTNETVATADGYCAIYAHSAGEAVITATTESGASKSINVKVYEIVTSPVTYEWDFKDYTSSSDYENNLTSSEANKKLGIENNYTIANGKYTSINSSYSKRPDLHADKEMYVDSLHNWSIEWRTDLSENSTLLGQNITDTSDPAEHLGYLYLAYKVNFGTDANPKYPVKFAPQTGSAILLPYGDHAKYASEMNSWKLVYTVDDNLLTLWCSLDEGVTWDEVSSLPAGEFSTSFENLFGRAYGSGRISFSGECEYIKINCYTRTKVTEHDITPTYRWDFDDMSATVGDNDLSPSDATVHHGAENNFTVANGMYSVDYEDVKSANTLMPDLSLENSFVLSSEKDWEIQWRGRNDTDSTGKIRPGILMGQSPTEFDSTTEEYGYIYLAPGTNFTSNKGYDTYPLKFSFDSTNKEKLLPYGDYRTLASEMNTWKLVYDAETNTVTLYASRNNGGVWSTVNSLVLPDFNVTISSLFGRMRGDGRLCFVGDMDYIQVSLAE